MSKRSQICLACVLVTTMTAFAASPRAQSPAAVPDAARVTVEYIIDRIAKTEAALTTRMAAFHPVIEVYIQNLAPDDQLGTVPTNDQYFLGQFEFRDGPKLRPLTFARQQRAGGIQYLPDGFAAMSAPDWRALDRQKYEFKYVKREFLGEARCFVLEVRPRKDVRDGFSGRIWVEDRDFNIVRFNGISRVVDQKLSSLFHRKLSFHVDSWRSNPLPSMWLPSYVYVEETDTLDQPATPSHQPIFKGQVRFWGYNAKGGESQQAFSTIEIEEPSVRDEADPARQGSPVLSQRRWELEAESNVLERLEKGALIAPRGEVDRVLETVVNNLLVTNDLALDAPVRCRVLLTSPLESFTAGHTIVLSRGLIDVLPDEASLATMLAHELSHIILGHPLIDTKFAFADRLMVGDVELLRTLRLRHDAKEEAAADAKVLELLKKSPYKDKLGDAGLFLKMIASRTRQLPSLIQPHFGDHIANGEQTLRLNELMQHAPELAPARLDQIAALPLGARLVLDPWSSNVSLVRAQTVPFASAREKEPLAITPLMPYLKYASVSTPAVVTRER
jgi:hypothetical protein